MWDAAYFQRRFDQKRGWGEPRVKVGGLYVERWGGVG